MLPRWLFPAVSLLAVMLASTALAVSLLHSHDTPGRVVQFEPAFEDFPLLDPLEFPLDDFYLMRVGGDEFVALYVYPPGFFGHVRGCRLHWEPQTKFDGVTGVWTEGCSGSKWDARGRHLFGPPGRDLDRFPVRVTRRGGRWEVQIDTRRLQCRGEPCERVPGHP